MSCNEERKNPNCIKYIEFLNNHAADKLPPKISYDQDFYDLQNRNRQIAISALNELQSRLAEWQTNNFKKEDCSPEWNLIGVSEEVGEISHIILKARQKIREHQSGLDEKALLNISDGIADTVIYLIQLCSSLKINFGNILFEIAEDVMKRNWKSNKNDGKV